MSSLVQFVIFVMTPLDRLYICMVLSLEYQFFQFSREKIDFNLSKVTKICLLWINWSYFALYLLIFCIKSASCFARFSILTSYAARFLPLFKMAAVKIFASLIPVPITASQASSAFGASISLLQPVSRSHCFDCELQRSFVLEGFIS